MHTVHVLTSERSERLHVLTFNEFLRGAYVVTVHAYEIHTGSHVAEVDASVVVVQFNGLNQLSEGIVNHSFFYCNIAVDSQIDVVVCRVRLQADAVQQHDIVDTNTFSGEGGADKLAFEVGVAKSLHTYIVVAVSGQSCDVEAYPLPIWLLSAVLLMPKRWRKRSSPS